MKVCKALLTKVEELKRQVCPGGWCHPSPEVDAFFELMTTIKEVCRG